MQKPDHRGHADNPKAEAKARANGYFGPWPPLHNSLMLDNADDLREIVGNIEKGEHRATFATALERYTFKFFQNMKTEEFRRMARAAIAVVKKSDNRPHIRARAGKLLINPMNKALKILLKLEDAADSQGIQHLQDCFRAYVEELALHKEDLKQASEMLFNMVASANHQTKLVGIEAVMDLILGTLDTLATVQEHDSRDLRLRTPIDRKNPKVVAAFSEMDELEERLQAKIRSEEESDRASA